MAHDVTLAAPPYDLTDDVIENLMRKVFEKTIRKLIHDLDTDLPKSRTIHRPADREPRGLMASGMLEEYRRINAASLARKSPQQLWKWCVARQSNLDTFLQAIGGDCPFHALEIKHTHRFHGHWQNRVLNGEVRINSANRMMRDVAGLYSAIHAFHLLQTKNPFSGLQIRGGREGKRLAYPASFVQQNLLADGTFDTLNPEARRIIYLIAETGLRPSEACALDASTIRLNAPIPFVGVTDTSRETKTPGSVRNIPLVGVALLAMQLQPNGFPRYRNKADVASATINKALSEKNLRPGGKRQTLYSLRHTLIDRLRSAEAPKDIQEDILGHVHQYGEGTSLEHRYAWLQRIAFKPPTIV
jgi:integrase